MQWILECLLILIREDHRNEYFSFCNGDRALTRRKPNWDALVFRFRFRCKEISWVWCFDLDLWRLRFDGVDEMWDKTERGKWERGKNFAEKFWGKWEMLKPKFATIISHEFWTNLTTYRLWAPQTSYNYRCCHWESVLNFWKHPIPISSFHRSNSNFWVLSDGNKC